MKIIKKKIRINLNFDEFFFKYPKSKPLKPFTEISEKFDQEIYDFGELAISLEQLKKNYFGNQNFEPIFDEYEGKAEGTIIFAILREVIFDQKHKFLLMFIQSEYHIKVKLFMKKSVWNQLESKDEFIDLMKIRVEKFLELIRGQISKSQVLDFD